VIKWISVLDELPDIVLPDNYVYAPHSKRLLVWVANGGDDHKGAACFGWLIESVDGKKRWVLDGYGFGSGNWKITQWAEVNRP